MVLLVTRVEGHPRSPPGPQQCSPTYPSSWEQQLDTPSRRDVPILCSSEVPCPLITITRQGEEVRQPLWALRHSNVHEPQTRRVLLPPIAWQNRIRREVADFPRNALCCTGNAWQAEKLLHWGTGEYKAITRTLGRIVLTFRSSIILLCFFAFLCVIAISFSFHFWALQRLSSSSCFRWYLC